MEIKEAIENPKEIDINLIKTLLTQGGRYKKMWEDLYEVAHDFKSLRITMDKIKQEYFPKEIKNG